MNRLFTRIILAMLVVSIVSLVVVPVAQVIALRRAFSGFAQDFRDLIDTRTQPPPFFRPRQRSPRFEGSPALDRQQDTLDRRPQPPSPPKGLATDGQASEAVNENVQDLNTRLFDYVSSYRSAQRRGVVFGIGVALLGCLGLSLWLAKSLAQPIEAVSNAAQKIAQGNLQARVSLNRESSQPKETQDLASSFNSMAQTLEQTQAERKAMIADIAHELRNPIASIQFRLDALSDGLIEFNEMESELLKAQVGLLSRLIDDLRTLSLADAGQLSLNREVVALAPLLASIVESQQSRAQNLAIKLSLGIEAKPSLQGDAQRLAQVILNLLDNGFKVMPNGGELKVTLSENPRDVLITVQDTGPGLPEAYIDTLFERFVKGERRDSKGKESSGLGLAIVKTLVNLHGGTISARNHAEGALFEIAFPKNSALV